MKYVSVQLNGFDRNKVFIRAKDDDGNVITITDDFSCDLYIENTVGGRYYTDTSGQVSLAPIPCESYEIFDSYINKHKRGVCTMYGSNNPTVAYMASHFDYDPETPLDLTFSSFDIEVAVPEGGKFPDPATASYPVNAVAYHTDSGAGYIFHTGKDTPVEGAKSVACDNEIEMLEKWCRAVSDTDPDVIGGWNSDNFDWRYIYRRLHRHLGSKDRAAKFIAQMSPFGEVLIPKKEGMFVYGRSVIDYMSMYKKLIVKPRPNYALDTIANIEVGRGKVVAPDGLSGWELWRHHEHYGTFLKYCSDDAKIVLDIIEASGLKNLMSHVPAMAHCNVEDLKFASRVWLAILLNYMKANGKIPIIGDNLEPDGRSDEKVIGAFTMEPKAGLHEMVTSVDMTSLYPSAMMALNISSDTYAGMDAGGPDEYCVAANGACFRKDFYGMFPTILEDMFKKRSEAKQKQLALAKEGKDAESDYYKNIQSAIKVLLNSAYGCIASKWFPYYDHSVAEAVTITGQKMVKTMATAINKMFTKVYGAENDVVIYCDTDSAYFSVKVWGDIDPTAAYDKVNGEVLGFVHRVFDKVSDEMGAVKYKFRAKTEVVCDKALFVAKKKYVVRKLVDEGVVTEGGTIKVTGLEANKPSHPELARKMLKEIYALLLDGGNPNDVIADMWKRWKKASPDDITPSVTISRLAANTAQAAAAKAYNTALEHGLISGTHKPITAGDKIRWAYTSDRSFNDGKIAWLSGDDCPLEIASIIDRRQQFEIYVVGPANIVSEAVGITVNFSTSPSVSTIFGRRK